MEQVKKEYRGGSAKKKPETKNHETVRCYPSVKEQIIKRYGSMQVFFDYMLNVVNIKPNV
jgi:hypothetical protein